MHIADLLQEHGYESCAKRARNGIPVIQDTIRSRNETKKILDENLFLKKLCNIIGTDAAIKLEEKILNDLE